MDRLPQSVNGAAEEVSWAFVYRMNLPGYPRALERLCSEALRPAIKSAMYDNNIVHWLLTSGVLPNLTKRMLQMHYLCTNCQLAPRLDDNTLCLQCLEEDDCG